MSLWADYHRERKGQMVIENESGFIAFHMEHPFCSIDEFYVKPEKRALSVGYDLANEVSVLAREAKCTHLISRIWINVNCTKQALMSNLKYGFEVKLAHDGCITLMKQLED